MNIQDDHAARIDELEARLAFQENALLELSDAAAAARSEAGRSAELLRRVLLELAQSRSGVTGDVADEPPPPHY
jgi:SlyX protein